MKRPWLILPDPLSIRIFFDTGVVEGLRERLDDALAVVFVTHEDVSSEWIDRLDGVPVRHREEHRVPSSFGERLAGRIDRSLDRHIGYYPLAIRLNERFGFHAERMQPRHENFMLDSARGGHLPRWPVVDRWMTSWFFSTHRHVRRRLLEALADECSGLVVSNVQPQSMVPYLTAARRLSLPVVAHIASWDHTVGKGVISPHCARYIVQNRAMEDDLSRYHGIESDRVVVTGWPQTDLYAREWPRGSYDALLRGYGFDPERPLVLFMGNTPTNAPYEGQFVARLVEWFDASAREELQLLMRPHPRDYWWRERFAPAFGRDGLVVQEPTYTDYEALAVLLRYSDAAVANAGTILLEALVNDLPVVCVLYDEGAPPGEVWAAKNVVGEHYEELAASGAFYRAETFDEVVEGIDRALKSTSGTGRGPKDRRARSGRRRRRARRRACRRCDRRGRGIDGLA